MILRHRSSRPGGLAAVLFPALLGALGVVWPPTAAAQALGTMQVTARVQPAPAAWPTLAATAQLAVQAGVSASAGRLDVGLARVALEDGLLNPRRVRIRVDYLRN
jgi:hypothetical protein